MQFHVADMACDGCVKAITQAILAIDPGALVSADLDSQMVRVNTRADQSEIAQALSAAGYPARAV